MVRAHSFFSFCISSAVSCANHLFQTKFSFSGTWVVFLSEDTRVSMFSPFLAHGDAGLLSNSSLCHAPVHMCCQVEIEIHVSGGNVSLLTWCI